MTSIRTSLDLANLLRYSAQLREEAARLLYQIKLLDGVITDTLQERYGGNVPERKDQRAENQQIVDALAKAAGAELSEEKDLPGDPDPEFQPQLGEVKERERQASGKN